MSTPIRLSSTFAGRPSALSANGARFLATDTGVVYISTGATWVVSKVCERNEAVGILSGDLADRPDAGDAIGYLYIDEDGINYEAFPDGWAVMQTPDADSSDSQPFYATGTMVKAVAATVTLTSNNTNVANNATVTIGNKVYTFKTALTPTEGEVLIGADADASLLNLIRAINHTGTPDTDYSCAAAHTQVSAAASVTAHAFVITALVKGAAANAYATTETSATLTFSAATLTGGVDTEDVVLLTDAQVGTSRKVSLQGFAFKVDGGTAWNEAASVSLEDNDGTVFATVLKAALTGNAYVIPTATNLGAAMVDRGAEGVGLSLIAASNESTGSDLKVAAWGLITPA
jgi:hypothetical protein